ncbi:hypothetical protein ACJZ2D_014286 [Fusarium nematophilum]
MYFYSARHGQLHCGLMLYKLFSVLSCLEIKAPQDSVDFPVEVVNCDNVDDLASFLEKNLAGAVISALGVASPEGHRNLPKEEAIIASSLRLRP